MVRLFNIDDGVVRITGSTTTSRLSLLLGLLLAAAALPQQPATSPVIGQVGVQLQWGTNPLQPGLIANLSRGFSAARIDCLWTMVEQQRGRYDFGHYDELAAQLQQHNVSMAWNLDYNNPLWQNGTGGSQGVAVTEPEAVAAFARFAVATVHRFHGRGIKWGLYNEPNGHGYGPDPHAYVTLVSAVGSALRAAGLGNETVTGPHVDGGFPILMGPGGWLQTVLAGGVLEYFDAVAVHPYRGDGCDPALPAGFCAPCDTSPGGCGPETLLADYARLRLLIAHNLPAGRPMPGLIASEVGWSTCSPSNSTLCCAQGHAVDPCGEVRCLGAWFSAGHRDEAGQAALVARQILVDALAGVQMTFIYDYKDDGTNLAASENNFGVIRSDNSPKPAFAAAATTREVLASAAAVKRLPVAAAVSSSSSGSSSGRSGGEIFALQFVDAVGNTTAVAVWNATGGCRGVTGSVSLTIPGAASSRCFAITTVLGEAAGTTCRRLNRDHPAAVAAAEGGGGGGPVEVHGVGPAVLYLRPLP
jgi:hypothetical protein